MVFIHWINNIKILNAKHFITLELKVNQSSTTLVFMFNIYYTILNCMICTFPYNLYKEIGMFLLVHWKNSKIPKLRKKLHYTSSIVFVVGAVSP